MAFRVRDKLPQMEQTNSGSSSIICKRVSDPKAAEYLSNPNSAVFLYPFIGRERTALEVARAYDIHLNALLYQIKRLLELELLSVVRLEPRKGRAIKIYRATADAFFVPFAATPNITLEAMVNQWSHSLQGVFLKGFASALRGQHPDWGVRISREENGQLLIAPAVEPERFYNYLEPDAPSVLEGWFTDLRLSAADAKSFQRELAELYFRYLMKPGDGRYILRVALAPMNENDLPPVW
jgi:hypothetical protein